MAKKWSELHKQFTHTTNSQAEAPHYVNFDMSTQTPILHGSNLKQYQKRTNEGGGTSSLPNLLDSVDCCLLYTSPSPRDRQKSRMPSSA